MDKLKAMRELNAKKERNEAIVEIDEHSTGYKHGFEDALEDALLVVEQIDVEQKPMLSKAEVNWLEKLREVKHNTDEMIVAIARQNADCDFVFKSDGVSYKLPFERYKGKESYGSVRHRLLYAVIYGYETKSLYTVEIPNPNASGRSVTFLARKADGKVELYTWTSYTSIEFENDWRQQEYAQLTEEEIKEDYAFLWEANLAKEVKE